MRCKCGAAVDALGAHYFGTCPYRRADYTVRNTALVHLLVRALRRSAQWRDVSVEVAIATPDPGDEGLRLDVRAVNAASTAAKRMEESVARPLGDTLLWWVVDAPANQVAAAGREVRKNRKDSDNHPDETPTLSFSPVVWETFDRLGPATAKFLAGALGGPNRSSSLAAFLTDASVILRRFNARLVIDGLACSLSTRPVAGEKGPPRRADISG